MEALEAMGFGGGRSLLAQVVRNNKGDLAACVTDLSQLQDWDTLLQDLEAMGFEDQDKNRVMLLKHRGSVKGAVRELVRGDVDEAAAAAGGADSSSRTGREDGA